MRLFFHLRQPNGILAEDEEGCECSTLEEGKREAVVALREIAAESLGAGELPPAIGIVIQDERGRILHAVEIGEALTEEPNGLHASEATKLE